MAADLTSRFPRVSDRPADDVTLLPFGIDEHGQLAAAPAQRPTALVRLAQGAAPVFVLVALAHYSTRLWLMREILSIPASRGEG